MTTILVVDDEANIRNLVKAYLEADGFAVETAADGTSGLQAFRRYQPTVVILDIMLPGMDGLEVLQHIRRESDAYVLMLTAKTEETDRVIGLTVGADDYLTKPFSPRELVARVKTILRRDRRPCADANTPHLHFPHIEIDSNSYEVLVNGEPVELTTLEFDLLKVLAVHAGRVLSREQLIEQVWGYDFYGDTRVVDVHIGHIRQKLEQDPANPHFITTVRGVGYKFVGD
ncbi:MAG: response regulator transcription factor [Chloroflexi bacterium]|nr:response regulator transcription factor [Chloroflexota bacterium]